MIQHPYPVGTLCVIVGTVHDHSENLGKQCEIFESLEETEWEDLFDDDGSPFRADAYRIKLPDDDDVYFALRDHVLAIGPDDDAVCDEEESPIEDFVVID